MDERVLRVLEFDKIIERLANHTDTRIGEELVLKLKPTSIFDEAKKLQEETQEADQIHRLNKSLPFGGIYDLRPIIKRASIGGVLDPQECLAVGSTLRGSRRMKRFIEKLEAELPHLKDYANHLFVNRELEEKIHACIDEGGEIRDGASEVLRTVRAHIRTYERRIREKLESMIQSQQKYLSEAIVTLRNNRYVLPVKQEFRSIFGGMVHDQSASGQTLFIEPRAIVEMNNQLRESRLREQREIERILRKLTDRIAAFKDELQENVLLLGKIDAIDARAQLASEMKAVRPTLNDQGYIQLKQARHPLIPEDEVVANDVELGEDYTAILITGPNTGGKTVVLKMVGLLSLMAQSGLQVPALEGCQMAVFEHVFADIGDEQSIEQSLSTFSSHMTNIVQILKRMNEQSLVLFDEIGAGTDPQEGAALAIAILDEVISKRARVIATTHYPELKAYGYNREHVINASVEFDAETLQPTYRLTIGIPGRSNAFDISRRLGLEEKIINQAKSFIGIDHKDVENMIVQLEHVKKQTDKEYEEAHEILEQSEDLLSQLKKEWRNFLSKRNQLYEEVENKAKIALEKAKEEAEQIVKELRTMQKNAAFKEHEWIEKRKKLEQSTPSLQQEVNISASQPKQAESFQENDEVEVLSLKQRGTVLEKINHDEYLVQIGMMRVNIRKNNLKRLSKQESTREPTPIYKSTAPVVRTELDLRGERYQDAMDALEQYVDRAILAGHVQVTIIHGKGTGALRSGVIEFAKNHPQIRNYRTGEANEGGSGVTVLEFG